MAKILRCREVEKRTGYCRMTIWRRSSDPDDSFPEARRLGQNSIGWLEAEIDEWLENLAKVSSAQKASAHG